MDLKNKREKLLDRLYHDPKSSACLAGVQRLYQEAKKIDPSIRKKDVELYLEGDRTHATPTTPYPIQKSENHSCWPFY